MITAIAGCQFSLEAACFTAVSGMCSALATFLLFSNWFYFPPRRHTLATLPSRWSAPVFPLKAADFIARGVEKGPALGAALAAAEEAWIAAGFPGDAASLDKLANEACCR